MRIALRNQFYRKCNLLEALSMDVTKQNYKFVRAMLKKEIVEKTEYDRKHTFTALEFDLLLSNFKKQA